MQTFPIPAGAKEVQQPDPVFIIDNPPPPTNQPPTADAGSDTTITLPNNSVILSGRGSDPEGSAVSFKWTKVSGSGNILAPNAANSEAVGLTEGVSIFRLVTTDDKGATSTPDDTKVTVKPAPIVVPPSTPAKYEGFGVAAASAANQTNIINIDTPAKFYSNKGSNRILRFTKAMTLTGTHYLSNLNNLFIDANGFDVTFDGGWSEEDDDGISIDGSSKNIIIAGIRVKNYKGDGINVLDNATNVIIINCSVYDNGDGNIDVAGGRYVSLIANIIGRGKPGFSGCSLDTGAFVSYLLNLITPIGSPNEGERLPLVHCNYSDPENPNADIRNNAMMNFGRSGGTGSGYGTAICYNARGNVVNNYYFDKESASVAICKHDGYGGGNSGQIYSAGNLITNGSTILSASMANNHGEFIIPDANKVTLLTALEAKAKVKAEVGPAVKNADEMKWINAI